MLDSRGGASQVGEQRETTTSVDVGSVVVFDRDALLDEFDQRKLAGFSELGVRD